MKRNNAPGAPTPPGTKLYLQVALGPPPAVGDSPTVYASTDSDLPREALTDEDRALVLYTAAFVLATDDDNETPENTAAVARLLASATAGAAAAHRSLCPGCRNHDTQHDRN